MIIRGRKKGMPKIKYPCRLLYVPIFPILEIYSGVELNGVCV